MDKPPKSEPDPAAHVAKTPTSPQGQPAATPEPEVQEDGENEPMPGILPNRDLKKNLGCG